jgi:hypothetical protein
MMFSHVNKTVMTSDGIGKVKATRGLQYYTFPGSLKIDMTKCANTMIDEFLYKLTGVPEFAWNENHFLS